MHSFVKCLRATAEFTKDPDDICAFADLLEAMGPVVADEYIHSGAPSLLWIRRLLAGSTMQLTGSGWLTATHVLEGKLVLAADTITPKESP